MTKTEPEAEPKAEPGTEPATNGEVAAEVAAQPDGHAAPEGQGEANTGEKSKEE